MNAERDYCFPSQSPLFVLNNTSKTTAGSKGYNAQGAGDWRVAHATGNKKGRWMPSLSFIAYGLFLHEHENAGLVGGEDLEEEIGDVFAELVEPIAILAAQSAGKLTGIQR
jgi:hypothetical protein